MPRGRYPNYSQHYSGPSFYSGYNEIVYGSTIWNANLPRTIEAFFHLRGHPRSETARWHRQFLQKYHVTADEVPILNFDRGNWWAPFSDPDGGDDDDDDD